MQVAVLSAMMLSPFALFGEDVTTTYEGLMYTIADGTSTATLTGVDAGAEAPTSVVVPATIVVDEVEYPVTMIGDKAFYQNNTLTSITLGENVERIGDQSFYNCMMLGEVVLNEGLKSMGSFVFWQDRSLKAITLPASLEEMGGNPFGMCSQLSGMEIAAENTHFAMLDDALYDKELTNLIWYPDWKYELPTVYFTYTAPETLKSIGSNALRGCAFMEGIVLPEGLETIGVQAFCGSGIKSITVPASVTKIEKLAFYDVRSLTSFSVAEGNTAYKADNGCLLTADGKTLVFGVVVSPEMVIPAGVEEIGERAFYQSSTITKLTFPSSLKKIGESACYKLSQLTEIEWGEGVEEIGRMAFQQCTSLQAVKLPASVRTLGFQCFAQCNMLMELALNEGLEEIGESAFFYDYNITSIEIPSTVKVLGPKAFCYAQRVASIVINEGVTSIPEACFEMCLLNTSLTLPSTLVEIGDDAFSYNQELAEVEFPEGLVTIGARAFTTCRITNVVLPNSVEYVGEMAFSNNGGMESFTSGTGLKVLGKSALIYNAVTSVKLNEGLEEIGETALSMLYNIEEIEIPSTVTTIGKYAFSANTSMSTLRNLATTPQVLTEELFDVGSFDGYKYVELVVPTGSVEAYKTADVWNQFAEISDNVSSIDDIIDSADAAVPVEYFDVQGRRLQSPRQGVNVVRMSDGTTRKVMVK